VAETELPEMTVSNDTDSPKPEQTEPKEQAEPRPEAEQGPDLHVVEEPAEGSEHGEAADENVEPERESELEARLRQVSAAYVKLQGEMQAFRERNERIQEERDRRRRGEVVTAMFEPVQNLRRSLDAWGRLDLPPEATQGLALVLEQFQGALRKLGLEEINASPVPFDPNIHDAIAALPTAHASLDGQVIQVFEAGYRVGSQVIQAARVVIGRYEAPVPSDDEVPAEPSEGDEE
jgi:molecular chaperone GrpE